MGATFKIGVFGLMFDDVQRLLICRRRDFDVWDFPGGGVEEGESPWDALTREVREETGCFVDTLRLFIVQNKPDQREFTLGYLCSTKSVPSTSTSEVAKTKLVHPEELPANFHREQRAALSAFLSRSDDRVLHQDLGGPPPRILWRKGILK